MNDTNRYPDDYPLKEHYGTKLLFGAETYYLLILAQMATALAADF